VSAYYYLRIIKTMYFDEPVLRFAGVPGELGAVMGISGFIVVTYFATVGAPLAAIARAAAESLF
jgi:NADH-quinone oxidoreductase subunit N